MLGTAPKAGTVMLVAPMSVESDIVLVRFAITDPTGGQIYDTIIYSSRLEQLDKAYRHLHCRSLHSV